MTLYLNKTGCYYDVLNDVIVHDAGPYSKRTCRHGIADDEKIIATLKATRADDIERAATGWVAQTADQRVAELDAAISFAVRRGDNKYRLDDDAALYWNSISIPEAYVVMGWNLVLIDKSVWIIRNVRHPIVIDGKIYAKYNVKYNI